VFLCAFVFVSGCGDDDASYIGKWMLVGDETNPVKPWKPEGYDATLTIRSANATVEEVFGSCAVTLVDVPYEKSTDEKDETFKIPYEKAEVVQCSPNPCDAVLPSSTGGGLGKCPDSMPPQALPGIFFRVKDKDTLMVDLPLWMNAIPGFTFRRVDDSN
jgi:hypothetical protein